MSVPDKKPLIRYVGDGATTEFYIPFPFLAEKDIIITIGNAEIPAQEYSIVDGNVIMNSAPQSGEVIAVTRSTEIARLADYDETGAVSAASLNDNFDRPLYVMQEIIERLDRCLSVKPTDLRDPNEAFEELISTVEAFSVSAKEAAEDAESAAKDASLYLADVKNYTSRAEGAMEDAESAAKAAHKSAAGISEKIEKHNSANDSHPDIREAIENLSLGSGFLPTTGGTVTGNLTVSGNIKVSDGKIIFEDIETSPYVESGDSGGMFIYASAGLEISAPSVALNGDFIPVSVNGTKANALGNIEIPMQKAADYVVESGIAVDPDIHHYSSHWRVWESGLYEECGQMVFYYDNINDGNVFVITEKKLVENSSKFPLQYGIFFSDINIPLGSTANIRYKFVRRPDKDTENGIAFYLDFSNLQVASLDTDKRTIMWRITGEVEKNGEEL